MPTRKADMAACAFAGELNAIAAPFCKTLTYDQGKELAAHESLALNTGMRIYFADPHAPWQRGANENTISPLRQNGHFTKLLAELASKQQTPPGGVLNPPLLRKAANEPQRQPGAGSANY
jgi:IS30 family transposase